MQKILSFLSCTVLLLGQQLYAQDLHVYFDAKSKNITYLSEGDTIYRPRVRKGEQIVFHLQNFNNFLFEPKLEVGQEDILIATTNGVGNSLFGGLSGSGISLMNGLSPIQGLAQASLNKTENIQFGGSGFGANVETMRQLNQLKSRYDLALGTMFRAEKQINFVRADIDAYLEGQIVNTIILEELNHLKQNPRLQPEQIRTLSMEYLEKVFQTEGATEVSLSGLLEKADSKGELLSYQQELQKASLEYQQSKTEITTVAAQLELFELTDSDFTTWRNSANEMVVQSTQVQQTITENQTQLTQLIGEATNKDIRQLVALRYEYEAIAANDFFESFRLDASGDQTVIKAQLLPKDSTGKVDDRNVIDLVTLKIPVYGGLRINTSVGVSFGQFFEPPVSYFVSDSVITAQKLDQFTPMLTSFFHFYVQGSRQCTLGGALGIGFPIVGGNGQQSIHFFIGPSIIIGQGERVVISGGVLGGKKARLAQGYALGDQFNFPLNEVPTTSNYELGYFLGISFNLLSKS